MPKSSKLRIIIGIIAAVAIVTIIVVAGIGTGVFLSPKNKILLAAKNTGLLEVADIVKAGNYTIDIDGQYKGISLAGTYTVKEKKQQLQGSMSSDKIPDIDFNMLVDEGKMQAYISLFNGYLFEYDINSENNGYLMDKISPERLDQLNSFLERSENSEGFIDFELDFSELEFEKAEPKQIFIDGENRSCKGYMTYIENENNRQISGMYVSVYIYKNKLVSVDINVNNSDDAIELLFRGGDERGQNIELISDGETVEISISKGAEIEDLPANKVFDIGNASETDVQSLLIDMIFTNPQLGTWFETLFSN